LDRQFEVILMSYKLRLVAGVIRLADGSFIPDDPRNAAWQQYQAWLGAGNTPEPADPPPPPSQDELDAAAAKAYAKLQALIAMSPAQVQAWVTANITTLPAAQDAIATLAIAVAVLARRL
jgi:hypothetical protein